MREPLRFNSAKFKDDTGAVGLELMEDADVVGLKLLEDADGFKLLDDACHGYRRSDIM
jgi:hypothetical protein